MSSIISNRTFLIATPNQIIQPPAPIYQQPINLPKIVESPKPKNIKKTQKYFLPEFYI